MYAQYSRLPFKQLRSAVVLDDTALATFDSDSFPASNAVKLDKDITTASIMFYGTGAADATAAYILYGRRKGNGPVMRLCSGTVTLGTQAVTKDPITNAALTALWCDTIAVTATSGLIAGSGDNALKDVAQNRICELRFNTVGISEIFLECDVTIATQITALYAIVSGY